jgi:hypothetical protein
MQALSTYFEQILLVAQGLFLFVSELGQRIVEAIIIGKLAQDIGGFRG